MVATYSAVQPARKIRVITIQDLAKITVGLQKNPTTLALDLETTGLNARVNKITTMQFGTLKFQYVLDTRQYYSSSADIQAQWRKIIRAFINVAPCIVGHNLAFDWQFLYVQFGVRMNKVVDTMLQEQIIHSVGLGGAEGAGTPVNMLDTGTRYNISVSKDAQIWFVGLDKPRKFYSKGQYYVEVLQKGAIKKYWFNADGTSCAKEQEPLPSEQPVRVSDEQWYQPYPEHQLAYMEQDVVVPLQIYAQQMVKLQQSAMEQVAILENSALPAFAWLCACGCHVDTKRWRSILEIKRTRHEELQKKLEKLLGGYMKDFRQSQYDEKIYAYEEYERRKKVLTQDITKIYSGLFAKGEAGGLTVSQYVKQELPKVVGPAIKKPTPKSQREIDAPINLGSHVQIKAALAGIGIMVAKTDKKHLKEHKRIEVVSMLLEWKALDKFISAFGDNILDLVDVDGRIHPTYAQIGARTGRTSCSKPNWQQLPSHEPDETSVRKCVIAEPGYMLLTCDLPNIELRILAELSGDKTLLGIFASGGDVHSLTAKMMFKLPEGVNLKELEMRPGLTYRSVAKTINFGLAYGMGADGLADSLGITKDEAIKLLEIYKATYKTAMDWLASAAAQGLSKGYSKTILGRKRLYRRPIRPQYNADFYDSYDEFYESEEWKKYKEMEGYIKRESKNSPIQGTNADITKVAMLLMYYELPDGCRMVASVHDEVCVEVPEALVDVAKEVISDCMYRACRQFLKVVSIDKKKELTVAVAPYWKKD